MPSIPEHKPESPESTGTGTAAIDEKTTQLADTGVLPLISASFWTLSLGKWLANTRLFVSPPEGGLDLVTNRKGAI